MTDVNGITLVVQQDDPAPIQFIGEQGPPGPVGPVGPTGPQGGANYIHTQLSVALTWIVNHNLGFRPNIEITTLGGAMINAEILHISDNQVHLIFVTATAGQARFI